jgi:uncharacterized protein (DUF736 family)
MNTEKYLNLLLDGSGHLNPNPNKKNDKHPDYGGYIKIENKPYRISAWVKIRKNGKKFLSLNLVDIESININEL